MKDTNVLKSVQQGKNSSAKKNRTGHVGRADWAATGPRSRLRAARALGCLAALVAAVQLGWPKNGSDEEKKEEERRDRPDGRLLPPSTHGSGQGVAGDGRGRRREGGRRREWAGGGSPWSARARPGEGMASHELVRASAMVAMEEFVELLGGIFLTLLHWMGRAGV